MFVTTLAGLASAQDVDWRRLVPQIREVLNRSVPGERIEETYKIQIYGTGDVTGDGIPEAIVYLGTGGASTDEVMLMRLEGGSPAVARFRQKDGSLQTPTFLRGASVTHSDDFRLVPKNRAVYSVSMKSDSEGYLANCTVTAYRWNASTKTFDWSRTLTTRIRKEACPKVGSPMP